ncbi:unnamed protein product [Blepharisma stoltei]|uniref:Hydro-lyase n=1 Tax=Blepharisma stoltei TaxID=1481888 RepID=A0AAU9J2I1_9CILI|nr:unnamed protein product [Blepharisma stoltei]
MINMRTDYLDSLTNTDFDRSEAQQFRGKCRTGEHSGPTTGFCMKFVQANLVILPKSYAYDFLLFCQRNPKPCPLLEVTEQGSYTPSILAPSADLRTDLPKYNILQSGTITDQVPNISEYWSEDLVSFLLGCSFSFEEALLSAKIPVRQIEENKNVPMYATSIPCRDSGVFRNSKLVVSMRPIPVEMVNDAINVTARFPTVHGSPVQIGKPEEIGIEDINKVDYGESVTINEGEIPIFWACGVTPMKAIIDANLPFAITHAPGHMFITDKLNSELNIFSI